MLAIVLLSNLISIIVCFDLLPQRYCFYFTYANTLQTFSFLSQIFDLRASNTKDINLYHFIKRYSQNARKLFTFRHCSLVHPIITATTKMHLNSKTPAYIIAQVHIKAYVYTTATMRIVRGYEIHEPCTRFQSRVCGILTIFVSLLINIFLHISCFL